MNRILTYLIGLLLLPAWCEAQNDVLNAFFSKMESNTLETEFAIVVEDGVTQPITYNGTLIMRGECFLLNMWNMEAAYDGNTLYIYSEDTEELTLSNPTSQELQETNPLLFAKALRNASMQRFATRQPKPEWQVIEFIPTEQGSGVQKFVLTLRKADVLPLEITMKESATQQTTLRLNNPHYTQQKPTFQLQKEDAIINDLR